MGDTPKSEIRAYVDGANLHKGIGSLGWVLHYGRFRSWLRQKYGVSDACLFIGLIPKHAALYTALQEAGFRLVYKEVVYGEGGMSKGNCDADLVLQVVRDYFEGQLKHAVLVSSDGDYAPLVRFLQDKNVPCTIVSPAVSAKCSVLLKRTNAPILYLQDIRQKIDFRKSHRIEKAPDADESA
ncbi:MAG: NYN domain-containing protein [Patescibacteria group bacterium]